MSTDITSDAHGNPVQTTTITEKMPRESVTVIVTLLVATFVVILNETIMNVALQRLMTDLSIDACRAGSDRADDVTGTTATAGPVAAADERRIRVLSATGFSLCRAGVP